MQQADARRGGGVEDLAGEEQTARLAQADRGDHMRRDHRRHQPQLHFRQRELGAVHADRDIAAGDQADTAAIGRTVDPREGRFGQELQGAHQPRQTQRIVAVFLFAGSGHAAHPVQVRAGRKAAAAAGEHHGAHGRVGRCRLQRGGELGDQGVVERVVDLCPVQGEPGHGAAAFAQDRVGHRGSPPKGLIINAGHPAHGGGVRTAARMRTMRTILI